MKLNELIQIMDEGNKIMALGIILLNKVDFKMRIDWNLIDVIASLKTYLKMSFSLIYLPSFVHIDFKKSINPLVIF